MDGCEVSFTERFRCADLAGDRPETNCLWLQNEGLYRYPPDGTLKDALASGDATSDVEYITRHLLEAASKRGCRAIEYILEQVSEELTRQNQLTKP